MSKYLRAFIFIVSIIVATAGAVAYCHNTFAPKSILDTIKQTRAVVCLIAIETLEDKRAMSHCADIIKN